MDVKRDILWRVYLSYIAVVLVCIGIMSKAFYIQQVQGKHWKSLQDSLHQKIDIVEAERGTIYSEDGQMLSTSIPQFDIYIDFGAEGLREKNGKRFKDNLDSLSNNLSELFKDHSIAEYKKILQEGYRNEDRYYLLQKSISYKQYQELKRFPLVRLGKNKSGFIADDKNIRLNPYNLLAYRTIGLDRANAQKIGLELTYDSILKGKEGNRLVRYIAGGVSVPIEGGIETEAENGKDIVTTIDVFIQEVTENALMKMMMGNEADYGCAIVMETKTGKIKAMANLGKRNDGNYWEDYNYAINPSEPGSTFKLATIISLLEDKKIKLSDIVNLEFGKWNINGQTVFDSEPHDAADNIVTVKRAFEVSSNVGMAKLAYNNYSNNPNQFIRRLHQLHLDSLTGIDLIGERNSVIYKPGSKYWSATTLPWMAFGYNIEVTPLQTITLYNAIADNGKMMKPYLVSAVKQQSEIVFKYEPKVMDEKICSDPTLKQVKECLEGVCSEGTARFVFKNSMYKVAGKTGTALVANGSRGYTDEIYQASFAGYFPADDPQYTCLVVIKNKPHALKRHGADVAAPVFKEIADRLYARYVRDSKFVTASAIKKDSSFFTYAALKEDVKEVMKKVKINYNDSTALVDDWAIVNGNNSNVTINKKNTNSNTMPVLKGMGLKDAVYLCESMGLKLNIKGKGRVIDQSIAAGQAISKGQQINIELN
jgi:cell division protein FtsI (penicillin-binding protein 3)